MGGQGTRARQSYIAAQFPGNGISFSPLREFGLVTPHLLLLWLVVQSIDVSLTIGCGVVGRARFRVVCLQVHSREGEKKRLVV